MFVTVEVILYKFLNPGCEYIMNIVKCLTLGNDKH